MGELIQNHFPLLINQISGQLGIYISALHLRQLLLTDLGPSFQLSIENLDGGILPLYQLKLGSGLLQAVVQSNLLTLHGLVLLKELLLLARLLQKFGPQGADSLLELLDVRGVLVPEGLVMLVHLSLQGNELLLPLGLLLELYMAGSFLLLPVLLLLETLQHFCLFVSLDLVLDLLLLGLHHQLEFLLLEFPLFFEEFSLHLGFLDLEKLSFPI